MKIKKGSEIKRTITWRVDLQVQRARHEFIGGKKKNWRKKLEVAGAT
jgi:hypothetical protein